MAKLNREYIRVLLPITAETEIGKVMPIFASDSNLYCLPVVDSMRSPIGIITEKDLKFYAYSAYGRELIRKKNLSDFIIQCPSVDIDSEEDDVLAHAGTSQNNAGVIVTKQGEYYGFIDNGNLLDIYEKNRVEKQQDLVRAQRLESLGHLTGGIAHELNNLLVPVVGYADILLSSSAEGDRSRKPLEKILSAADKAKHLVEQVLTFSRKGPQVFVSVSLAAVLKEACSLVHVGASRNIEIRTAVNAAPDVVKGDATQLNQVILNLCSNAIRAIEPASGVISILLDRPRLPGMETPAPGLPAGDYLRISVTDNGCGIPGEIIDKIFDPFFTTRRNEKGTGLGLSVVHGIVKAHGGALTVQSVVGTGSTFNIYLPASSSLKPAVAVPAVAAKPAKGNGRILVVDDNVQVTDVWGMILREFGYEVAVYNESLVALDRFREQPTGYDLIITDQIMPDLCGSELASEMLNINPGLPIILCTGYGDAVGEEHAARIGIKKYLRKPLNSTQLVSAVQEFMPDTKQ